jgi:hypothetical protein
MARAPTVKEEATRRAFSTVIVALDRGSRINALISRARQRFGCM